MRISVFILFAVFAAALALAPQHAAAQATTAAPAGSTAASAQPLDSAGTPPHKEEAEQEKELLHAPVVQSLARMLHLNLETTIYLLLGINFAIIFFAIAIPLARIMPKIIRKRSETLSV